MRVKFSTPQKILFVLNPISGGRNKSFVLSEIETFCDAHHIDLLIFNTTGEDDKSELSKNLDKFKPDALVAIGGDGTVNLCASIVVNTEIKLGIIPLGSGNGLSKDLTIPQNNVAAALSLFIEPLILKIDTLTANGFFFLHMCDIGFNARIVRLFAMSSRRGFVTYAYHAVHEYFNYKSSSYKIMPDDELPFRVRAFMITAANSNKFGSNITINPQGKVDDGKFELVIIKSFPNRELPKLIWQILLKKIHFSPYTRIISARKVTIFHKKLKTLQVDGEVLGRFTKIEIIINPSSLNVIVPA